VSLLIIVSAFTHSRRSIGGLIRRRWLFDRYNHLYNNMVVEVGSRIFRIEKFWKKHNKGGIKEYQMKISIETREPTSQVHIRGPRTCRTSSELLVNG
jgi:hypothetical protein